MRKILGKKRNAFSQAELQQLEAYCADYWKQSRALESETVRDLEKHLWLANAAAATASIALLSSESAAPLAQYIGAWAFVTGILSLVVMKFVSTLSSSSDRYRFESAKSRFHRDETTDEIFSGIRDRVFACLRGAYLSRQWGSGIAFIAGLVLTLIGVRGDASPEG